MSDSPFPPLPGHPESDVHSTPAMLRPRFGTALSGFLTTQAERLAEVGGELEPVASALRDFVLDGGKRLRPLFCYWGWRATGAADETRLVTAAAALELLQACALIHDDLMDGSNTRRGVPSFHRRFERLHRQEGWAGAAETFGAAAAILAGDLCLSWSDEMFTGCGLDAAALRRARPVFDMMRTEVLAGQYLDVLEQATAGESVERARRVIRYKTAKYTVERPLQLGAALAAPDDGLLADLSGYGLPLGEAFQLRDDLLGVFGDPGETGKPSGDDLREGKRTVLAALTMSKADEEQARVFRAHLGDPELDQGGVERLREVMLETGAVGEVERLIRLRTEEALEALESERVDPVARRALAELAVAVTDRRL